MASPSKSASSDPVPSSDPAPSVAAPTPSGPAPAGPPPARAAAIEARTGTTFERWEAFIAPRLAGLGLENRRTSRTERWLYWRADGIDGTRVAGTLQVKGDDRTVLAIGHEKLADADDRAARKAAWTQTMKEFTAP